MKKNLNYKINSMQSSLENLELRKQAWKDPECQSIYQSIISNAGGFNVVRPGMRGRAKEMAITSYLKNEVPCFEEFKNAVEKANEININRKK